MIIERNVFHLKFGKAKDGIALWKQILQIMKQDDKMPFTGRLLSDLSGSSYVLIVEFSIKNFNEFNILYYFWLTNPKLAELYQQFVTGCDHATREFYKIEMEI